MFLLIFFLFINLSPKYYNPAEKNIILIKILRYEHIEGSRYTEVEVQIKNNSPNHLDRFFLNTYVYDKNGIYLGRSLVQIFNLAPNKFIIKSLYFSNVQYRKIDKWEFVLDDVLTIKEKELEHHKDYKVKLLGEN